MFGMEKLHTCTDKGFEKKAEKENLLRDFIHEKEASDHLHVDSEGKKTSPSIHEEGEEENPHKHKLKDGGETDKKPSGDQHTHKEKDEDGGKTGPAIKTASERSRLEQGFIEGLQKQAVSITLPGVAAGLTAAGAAGLGYKQHKDRKANAKKAKKYDEMTSKK